MEIVKVRTFGGLSLEFGGKEVSDSATRSRKGFCLLAYLLCNRTRVISQATLIDLLWGDEPASSNPVNVLRITLHRLRNALDELWPNAGKEIILHKEGGYCWNPDIPIELDFIRFEELITGSYETGEARLQACLDALTLYQGEFLPKFCNELWAIPISTHYHNLFLQTSLETAQALTDSGDHKTAALICQKASVSEPYHEHLHQLWMQTLAADGDTKGAAKVYDGLNKRLFDDFGIRPSEQTRSIYRQCALSPEDRTLPIDEVLENLQEPNNTSGAMVCDYDYFKVLCFAEKRSMERNGNATHVALFSVVPGSGNALPKKNLDRVMDQLQRQMQVNLRRGDILSQCSASQLIVMLPNANYENSCMVCRRLLAAFHQVYPRAGVKVNFMVQPLTPDLCVP